jgi:hypothetical protein
MGEYAPGYFKLLNPDGTYQRETDPETHEEKESIVELDATGIVNLERAGYKLERVQVEEKKEEEAEKASAPPPFIPPSFVELSQTTHDKEEDEG